MKINLTTWKLKEINSQKGIINPKPQYQRTSVWSPSKKKLFIDSILRGYDVPKFYLRSTPSDPLFEYEVIDGQQRMRSIWEFMSDDPEEKYVLNEAIIKDLNTKRRGYSNLDFLKEPFDDYKINVAIIEEASPEEIRSLFARLQMGEQLNKVELRHAMASNIGSAIISVTETHDFFKESKIHNGRYKHQDYLDHVITLAYYNGLSDVKAKNIEDLYKALANASSDIFGDYIRKSNSILDWMRQINALHKGIFRNKWAFVDTFWLLYKHFDNIQTIDIPTFKQHFISFESRRLQNHKKPEELIKDPALATYDLDLYNYIIAFKYSGNIKGNIEKRFDVFKKIFINKSITLTQ